MIASLREPLAALAAAVLLAVLFLLLCIASVALYLVARAVPRLGRSLEGRSAQLAAAARELEVVSREVAHSAVEPQIRLASTLTGWRAGFRALVRGPRPRQ